jgi:hypothetical protein
MIVVGPILKVKTTHSVKDGHPGKKIAERLKWNYFKIDLNRLWFDSALRCYLSVVRPHCLRTIPIGSVIL